MYALAVHGGAGSRAADDSSGAHSERCCAGLTEALQRGRHILERGGSALDAVEAAVIALEDDSLFNAGRGAVLTREGTAELDAAIMDGASLRAGAVGQVRHVRNPIRLARWLLEHSPHVFLVGAGADACALKAGLEPVPNDYFITPERQQQLAALSAALTTSEASSPAAGAHCVASQPARRLASANFAPLGTVGAVARDRRGNVAAATSTGGTAGQLVGRIGDSPVIGAGTYADDESCAVSTTGHGEAFLRSVLAYDISARVRYRRDSLPTAVDQALSERLSAVSGRGGVIAVNAGGQIVIRHNAATLAYGHVSEDGAVQVQAW